MFRFIRKLILVSFVSFSCFSVSASQLLSSSVLIAPLGSQMPYVRGTEALKPVNSTTFNIYKGDFGEELTNIGYLDRLKKTGWQAIQPRDGRQGMDHFALKFNDDGVLEDVLVAETKFTKKDGLDALGHPNDGTQMSRAWIEPRVEKSIVSKYADFAEADRNGRVRVVDTLPSDGNVDLFPIDNGSYYFVDNNTGEICFYSSKDVYSSAESRAVRCERTSSSLMEHIKRGKFRRVVVHYEVNFTAVGSSIIRTVSRLGDGVDGPGSVVELSRHSEIIPKPEYERVLNTDDYKQSIAKKYGFHDVSFLESFDENMKLKLITGIDSETANKVFALSANRIALSNKLNVNPAIDYRKLDLSDGEWTKLLATDSLYGKEMTDGLVMKIREASRRATILGGVTAGASAGALAGISTILSQGLQVGFDSINWKSVAYSSTMGVSVGILNTAGEAASRALLRVGNERAAKTVSSFILKGAGVSLPFFLDTLVDVGFGIYNLYNGTYISGWQAAADIAVNAGVNLGIVGLAALAGTTFGGPIGTAVGIVGGGIWAFGSYYVINPITSTIERHTIFDILESDERVDQIQEWTENALATQFN